MKLIFPIIFLALILSGCGSLRTVVSSNSKIENNLKRNDTYCSHTTRVYSGITYNFCRFNAEPKGSFVNLVKSGAFVIDTILLSPVMDTVLLPVTIPQQVMYGNPQID